MIAINRKQLEDLTEKFINNLRNNSPKTESTIIREIGEAKRLMIWMKKTATADLTVQTYQEFSQTISSQVARKSIDNVNKQMLSMALDYPEIYVIIRYINNTHVINPISESDFEKLLGKANSQEKRILLYLCRDTDLLLSRLSVLTLNELRSLKVSKEAEAVISPYIGYRLEYPMNDGLADEFVFVSRYGKNRSATALRYILTDICSKAGLLGLSRRQILGNNHYPAALGMENKVNLDAKNYWKLVDRGDPEERLMLDILCKNKIHPDDLALLQRSSLPNLKYDNYLLEDYESFIAQSYGPMEETDAIFYNYKASRKASKQYVQDKLKRLAIRSGLSGTIASKSFYRANERLLESGVQIKEIRDEMHNLKFLDISRLEKQIEKHPRANQYKIAESYYIDESDFEKIFKCCQSVEEQVILFLMRDGVYSPSNRKSGVDLRSIKQARVCETTARMIRDLYMGSGGDIRLMECGKNLKSMIEELCNKAGIVLKDKRIKRDTFSHMITADQATQKLGPKKTVNVWLKEYGIRPSW